MSPQVTAIDEAIQAFQVDVWQIENETTHHLVVNAYYPELERDLCDQLGPRLAKYFGDVIVSFTVSDEDGKANFYISSLPSEKGWLLSVGKCNFAVVKRSCGWEEKEIIRILCENTGESIEVKNPRNEENHFVVEVYPEEEA